MGVLFQFLRRAIKNNNIIFLIYFFSVLFSSLLGPYPNTYIFTKAVAESLCKTKAAHLPLAVFRPAIGISSQFNSYRVLVRVNEH